MNGYFTRDSAADGIRRFRSSGKSSYEGMGHSEHDNYNLLCRRAEIGDKI